MNEPIEPGLDLPGLASGPSRAPQPPAAAPAPPRVKPVDRSQAVWRAVDVEELIEPDHPARAIWALSGQLDLKGFYGPIEAVAGEAGRPAWDPRLLVSLWVYALSRGISSAREIQRRCAYEPAFQWLCGLEVVNHHTLSDFRVAHGSALEELFVQVLGVLSSGGLVSLERVMHDGTKIKACASADTFGRQERLQAHLEAARQQVRALAQEAKEEPTRQQAARQRAARERQQRVEAAVAELEQIRQTKETAKEKAAVRASTSDPQARIMKQGDGGFAPSYNAQITTEASHKIIVGAGLSQNSSDYGELLGGVERVEHNLGAKPKQLVTDGGFTSRENILATAAQGIDLIGS
jgi:transposase